MGMAGVSQTNFGVEVGDEPLLKGHEQWLARGGPRAPRGVLHGETVLLLRDVGDAESYVAHMRATAPSGYGGGEDGVSAARLNRGAAGALASRRDGGVGWEWY
jgi:hypothetical protein